MKLSVEYMQNVFYKRHLIQLRDEEHKRLVPHPLAIKLNVKEVAFGSPALVFTE